MFDHSAAFIFTPECWNMSLPNTCKHLSCWNLTMNLIAAKVPFVAVTCLVSLKACKINVWCTNTITEHAFLVFALVSVPLSTSDLRDESFSVGFVRSKHREESALWLWLLLLENYWEKEEFKHLIWWMWLFESDVISYSILHIKDICFSGVDLTHTVMLLMFVEPWSMVSFAQ